MLSNILGTIYNTKTANAPNFLIGFYIILLHITTLLVTLQYIRILDVILPVEIANRYLITCFDN